MRILLDNSSYHLRNYGDIAMLQMAVWRLNSLWPGVLIEVVTDAPQILFECCPAVRPISSKGRAKWLKNQHLFSELQDIVPLKIFKLLLKLEKIIWLCQPILARNWMNSKISRQADDDEELGNFLEAISESDLVVASGGGYITDAFQEHAIGVLSVLEKANQQGKLTAMFGQGIGPVQSGKLFTKAKQVLPHVDFIGLREKRAGLPILKSLGVPLSRVMVTGDDAVELLHERASKKLGTGIGINLRVAAYSKVTGDQIEVVRSALQAAGKRKGAPLIAVPISLVDAESDAKTIREILSGYDDKSDGGERIDSLPKLAEQVGRCRIVITGSYHAGVFALSQGIPVIGLAKSAYYVGKFLGLADQFTPGCEVLLLDDRDLHEKLITSINFMWDNSEQLKPTLLSSARQQIALSRQAYQHVYEMVESRKTNQLNLIPN